MTAQNILQTLYNEQTSFWNEKYKRWYKTEVQAHILSHRLTNFHLAGKILLMRKAALTQAQRTAQTNRKHVSPTKIH